MPKEGETIAATSTPAQSSITVDEDQGTAGESYRDDESDQDDLKQAAERRLKCEKVPWKVVLEAYSATKVINL